MRAKIVGCIVLFAAGSLAGCGFKSDLFLPEEGQDDLVRQPDAQPDAQPDPEDLAELSELTESDTSFFPSGEVEDGNIKLDKVTTIATDAEILVPAGTQEQSQNSSQNNSQNNSLDNQTAEGISVDLTELARDVERQRESQ